MNPNLDNVRWTMSKTELQKAIIELRNQGKQVRPDPPSSNANVESPHFRPTQNESAGPKDPTPAKAPLAVAPVLEVEEDDNHNGNIAAAEANTDQNRDQPHPNASCITPAPARESSNQGHGQAQVASTLDEAPNAEGNSSQAKVSDRDILRAINTGYQAQRDTNEVYREQFAQHNEQMSGLLQTQNVQGATIAQQGQEITAHSATLVQQGQKITANTKVSAQAMGIAQVALLTAQKALKDKDKKGLLGRNSDPLQRARTGNLFDTPPTDIGE
jgi:hypothetical protein